MLRYNEGGLAAKERFEALDGLRGVAALYVVLFHANWQTHLSQTVFIDNGYLAVDLFFVLSGFVIASAYGSRIRDGLSATRFLVRRFFRLYPLHLFMLLCFVALEGARAVWVIGLGHPANGPEPFAGERGIDLLVAHLFLVQGLGFNAVLGWNAPSWSISCEYFAYVGFAAVALWAVRHRLPPLPLALVAAIALYWPIGQGVFGTFGGSARCAAGFTLGACLAGLARGGDWQSRLPKLGPSGLATAQVATAGVILATLALAAGPWAFAAAPLFGLLLVLLIDDAGPLARILRTGVAQYLGRISYSIYMVHMLLVIPVTFTLKRLSGASGFSTASDGRLIMLSPPALGDAFLLVYVAAVLIAATFTYRFVEEPGRLLGRRLADEIGVRRARRAASN